MSEEKAKELGVKPMATWVAGELAGVEPRIMGIGPVAATRKVMKKAGYEIGDFDLIEANEAFAAQSVAVAHDLGFNNDILNVNGGAIALGHPVGASGCRILVTLLHEMEKEEMQRKVLLLLCVGGGHGLCSDRRARVRQKNPITFQMYWIEFHNKVTKTVPLSSIELAGPFCRGLEKLPDRILL